MDYTTEARRHLRRVAVCAALALALASCETPFSTDGNGGDLFFTQSVEPEAVMDALFTGRVVRGENGCLRLASRSGPTVIWPVDYSLDAGTVRDAAGDEVGSIGGNFRLAGGEVPSLHDGIEVTANTRKLAEAHCTGKYWIVAGG